jgi:hypothetical protein
MLISHNEANLKMSLERKTKMDAKMALSHHRLLHLMRKGFRNGSWRKLDNVDRALYMASLSLAKMRGRLVNSRLILKLQGIMGRLDETPGLKALRAARERAAELYGRFRAIGLFDWAPRARSWFDDPSYVQWLGLSGDEVRH